MHFGRVDSIESIDFKLPEDGLRTQKFLKLKSQPQQKFIVGAPIWGCPEWVGKVYPEGARSKDYLFHYSRKFPAIELNSTFYHLPSQEQLVSWIRQVPKSFLFCPKAPKQLSHYLGSPDQNSWIRQYSLLLEGLGEHLGLPFLQLPENFSMSYGNLLINFLDSFTSTYPLAIEFRHASWFEQSTVKDKVVNAIYRAKKSIVITDTPGRRDVLHSSIAHPSVMIRFLGQYRSGSDEKRLRSWIQKLDIWLKQGIDQVFFFIHQPDDRHIPETIEYLNWRWHSR